MEFIEQAQYYNSLLWEKSPFAGFVILFLGLILGVIGTLFFQFLKRKAGKQNEVSRSLTPKN